VRGSAFDLRFTSRILCGRVYDVRYPGREETTLGFDAYLISLSMSSSIRPFPLSEYHGFKSFSDGARGTPLSVSSAGFLTFVDMIISCCKLVSTLTPRATVVRNEYLLQILEQVYVALGALNHVRSPLAEQLLLFSFLLPFARLGRDTSPALKQVHPCLCILFREPGVSASEVKWGGRVAYSQQHASFRSSLFQLSLLLIFPDAFNVISPIRVIGFVMSDVQLAHDEW